MLTSDFDYNLPPEAIAQTPAEPRDSAKLMVVDRRLHTIQHRRFFDILEYLQAGDLVVWNNSKVFKARLRGQVLLDNETDGVEEKFVPTGKILNVKEVEIFLVRPMENAFVWKVLARPGKRLRLGMKVRFAEDFVGEVMLKEEDGTLLMQFADDDMTVRAKANRYGEVPLPPYINSPLEGGKGDVGGVGLRTANIPHEPPSRGDLSERYQTVYAKHEGSVAAPTAGFHFTPELIEKLKNKGVQFAEVTLHVGLGTFLPVKTEKIEEHRMHSEQVELAAKNADLINTAKQEGRRIVAVGTTTVRTLEGVALLSPPARGGARGGGSKVRPYTGDINIFITPGFKFQIVDALITNFHLPKSTLLMLVSAFAGDRLVGHSPSDGRQFVLDCYTEAIKEKYRFYSFGDAMLIK